MWRTSGQLIEEPLLWDGAKDRIPMGLAHPKLPLVISGLLKDYVSAQLGDSYPSLVLPSIHMVIEVLNLHVIPASWDVQVEFLGVKEFNLPFKLMTDNWVLIPQRARFMQSF